MEAVTLLAAPLIIRKTPRIDLIALIYLTADIIIVASIFIFNNFPATYIEGVGLTPFKIISEYIICLLLIASVVLLYRSRESFDRQVLDNLVIAIVLTIVSELAFTEYASFVDIFSVIGHVVRLLAYYFFYRAIIEIGQEKPYNILYRDLNESEKKYRALSDLSPDVILVHRQGKILYLNQAGLRFFGISDLKEIDIKNILDYIVPRYRPVAESRIATVETLQVITPLAEIWYKVNDRIVPAEVTTGPILWEGTSAIQSVIRDITERKHAEEELVRKNADLNAAYEEIAVTKEELQKKNTVLNEALNEKEILLSEIHHRVKNNLTAFISLLSLEGSYEESPAGAALRNDLQNRARSMALIHETLYQTKKFSNVDMGMYLTTLTDQIAASYSTAKNVQLIVNSEGTFLDIARATPCGLIINELVTNSLKYAFPESFDCKKIRNAPCMITVLLTLHEDVYTLIVRDNGIGLSGDLDISATKTLGLKLVYFLAKHQLRASVEVTGCEGAEFVFRFQGTTG
jgi:PAS domain S-box-containing protein